MIDKQYWIYKLVCDNCGDESEKSFKTYKEAIYGCSEDGWIKRYENGVWNDYCPECKEE